MKKLLLVRHAKASHESSYIDFERPLTHSGLNDAAVMAQRLNKHNIVPQMFISSPALRALTTANIFSEHLSLPKVQTDMLLYDAKKGVTLGVINSFPAQYDFIGLAGHNPDISEMIYYLTGKSKDAATCAVALIIFETNDWKEVSENTGELLYYDEP